MLLTENKIKKIRRAKGYAGIWPRFWLAFFVMALVFVIIIIQLIGYYSCYYCTFQLWEKIAVVLIPIAVGFASLLLAVAGSAPKLKFLIAEKGRPTKAFYPYMDKNGKVLGIKQHLDLANELGLPVKVKVTVFFGRKGTLSTDKIVQPEYRYLDSKKIWRLAPRANFYNASFNIKDIEGFNEGDLILVVISARNTFATLKNFYQLWYFDPTYTSWVPDIFFGTF